MRYLLDVNALIAYGFRRHSFHNQVGAWMQSHRSERFFTCSITELGFVRVLGNVRTYGLDVARARTMLLSLKTNKTMPIDFLADGNDLNSLPSWVKSPQQLTNGHLLHLANAHNAVLATFDNGIPGAHLIP
jgi:predicted nucleic acid-binding protein